VTLTAPLALTIKEPAEALTLSGTSAMTYKSLDRKRNSKPPLFDRYFLSPIPPPPVVQSRPPSGALLNLLQYTNRGKDTWPLNTSSADKNRKLTSKLLLYKFSSLNTNK
jgi:hypothetical protein